MDELGDIDCLIDSFIQKTFIDEHLYSSLELWNGVFPVFDRNVFLPPTVLAIRAPL